MIASHNHYLGEFTIGGIPSRPAGMEPITVAFTYDLNGLLNVSATVDSTGKNASIEINLGREKPRDVSEWKEAEGAKPFRTVIRTAERLLKKEALSTGEKERIEDLVYQLKKALIDGERDRAEDTADHLNAILAEARD